MGILQGGNERRTGVGGKQLQTKRCRLPTMWKGRTQNKSMFRPNHVKRHQASPTSEDAYEKGICRRNEKDPGQRAREGRRQYGGNRDKTKDSLENRRHPEKDLGGRLGLGKHGHRHAGFSLRSPLPVGSDLYITTGLQTMAITKKRSRSSAEEDDSDDGQDKDGGPSRKTASEFFNVKSSESLPLPRSGPVPVVTMIVNLGQRKEILRILLDTGLTVPLLLWKFAQLKKIPVAERLYIRPIQYNAGQDVEGAGQFYPMPPVLQHRYHFSRVSFEVAP